MLKFDNNSKNKKRWEGMTFEELFNDVKIRGNEIIKRLREDTGNNIFTEEFDKTLTEEEREVLQMVNFFNGSS